MALSTKTMLFVCLLVAAVAVVPAAAQINLGGLIGGLLGPLLGLIRIQGTLFCNANLTATVGSNGTIVTPPLSNVTVQLRCGSGNGTLAASVLTNNQGTFSIMLDPSLTTVTQVLSGCRLVVATPLANCNATVPSVNGILSSTLTLVGSTLIDFFRILNLVPTGFTVPV